MKRIVVFIALFLVIKNSFAQSFQNGDLDGIVNGTSSLPNNWLNVPMGDVNCLCSGVGTDTPDLTNISGPWVLVGINGNPFTGTTFVSGVMGKDSQSNNFFHEGIMQLVHGFYPGDKFSIHIRQTVAKHSSALDKSGSWAVYIDSILVGITNPSRSDLPFNSASMVWDLRTITFTAAASSHLIKFLPMDDDTNYIGSFTDTTGALYMGIDSIGLDILTGINSPTNLPQREAFKLLPNPSSGSFIINSIDNLLKQTTLSITDVCGKQIDIIPIVNSTTSYENKSLTNGLYFYTIRSKDEELQRGKFLVVK